MLRGIKLESIVIRASRQSVYLINRRVEGDIPQHHSSELVLSVSDLIERNKVVHVMVV
jgi:hypothetical protein